jgi:hypothetical protein
MNWTTIGAPGVVVPSSGRAIIDCPCRDPDERRCSASRRTFSKAARSCTFLPIYHESARLRIPRDGTLEAVFYVARPGKFPLRMEFRAFDYASDVSLWRYVRMTR